MRLHRSPGSDWQDRGHFLRLAGRVMRNVLVDRARRRRENADVDVEAQAITIETGADGSLDVLDVLDLQARGTREDPFVKAALCADSDGFSLHAAVRVRAGDRKRLEHLCRYAGRSAIAASRLSQLPDGRLCYALKRTWKDGTTHQVLIERLLALVPRPRRHQLTYYGVLAPAAGLRSRVVPQRELGDEAGAVAGAPSVRPAQRDALDALRARHGWGHRAVPPRASRQGQAP